MPPNICSAVILVKTPLEEIPKIIEIWPSDFSLGDQEPYFKASVKIHNRNSSNFIFQFNTPMFACVSLNFCYNTIYYSLVIMTQYPFFHFYKQLFRIANQSFLSDVSVSTPINRFYYICTSVAPFPDVVPPKLTVTFPATEFEYTFRPGSYTYKEFNPTKYFNIGDCQLIWRALFTNEPVLIVTTDPFAGSSAVLAAASLLAPLQFTDEMCLWLTETDPRFVAVVNGDSKLLVAATSSESLATATNHFAHIIRLSPKRFSLNPAMTDRLYTKMKRTLLFTNYELDNLITDKDPYYDLVEGKLSSKQFLQSLRSYSEFELPTPDEFDAWETTMSFKNWRSNRNVGHNFRDGVLNIDPLIIFNGKSKSDVEKIYEKLDGLLTKYSSDIHVVAVLKKHKKLAKQILRSF